MRWILANRFVLLSLAIPVAIRTLPEVIAGQWPLGFDTVTWYAPFVKEVETKGFGPSFLGIASSQAAPLVYSFLGLAAVLTNAAPFAITKAAAPMLYGSLGLSLYYFARRRLRWTQRKSLMLVLVSTLYFVSLRFSWDMYKNLLGTTFLFLSLSHFRESSESDGRLFFVTFSSLGILASEAIAVLLGATVGLLFLWELIKRKQWNLAALGIVAISTIAILFYSHMLIPLPVASSPLMPPPPVHFFPFSYVGSAEGAYPSVVDLYASVLLLSGMILAPILPLGLYGFFGEKRLTAMIAVLSVGSFSVLILPFGAIPVWHRWLFMLTFPLFFMVSNGLSKLDGKKALAFLLVLVSLGLGYSTLPPDLALPYYTARETVGYVPSSLLQNTVPLQDSPDIVNALGWLSEMRPYQSVLVAHLTFEGWALLYTNGMEVYRFVNAAQVDYGNFSGYRHVFLLYWAPQQGWYNSGLMPDDMLVVHSTGRIAIYERVK